MTHIPSLYHRIGVRLLSSMLLLSVMVLSASGQQVPPLDPATAGRSYLIAFPDTTTEVVHLRPFYNFFEKPDSRDSIALFIYSEVENHIEISGPMGYRRTVLVHAGSTEIVYLNDSMNRAIRQFVDVSGEISRDVFHVDADQPIILTCYINTKFGAEAWVPISVDKWGTEYVASCAQGEIMKEFLSTSKGDSVFALFHEKGAPAEILMIAAYDQTRIQIEPTAELESSQRTTITLNAGECYQVQSRVLFRLPRDTTFPQPDISGTRIIADKPIGVISGNSRSRYGDSLFRMELETNSCSNMSLEWLAPQEQMGTIFTCLPVTHKLDHYTPLSFNTVVAVYRVVSLSDEDIQLRLSRKIKGDSIRILHPRSTVEVRIDSAQAFVLTSSRPVQVTAITVPTATHGIRSSATASHIWGGCMSLVAPREQWTNFAPIRTPLLPDSMEHEVYVVTDTGSHGKVLLKDGSLFNFNLGRIDGTDLIWGKLALKHGFDSYLQGIDGARFYAEGYGTQGGFDDYSLDNWTTLAHGDTAYRYTEIIPRAYRMPLAPKRTNLANPGSVYPAVPDPEPGEMRLYPNPFRGALGVSISLSGRTRVSIEISNSAGTVVYHTEEREMSSGESTMYWDAKGLPQGVYNVRLHIGSRIINQRAVLIH